MRAQAVRQRQERRGVAVVKRERRDVRGGERGSDRGADSAGPDHEAARTLGLEAVALEAAHESRAVEQIAVEHSVGTAQDGVARLGNPDRDAALV